MSPLTIRRSTSRSRRNRTRSRSSSRSGSRSHARTFYDRKRLHVGDIGYGVTQQDLERSFEVFGRLEEVWKAGTVPGFAFVVYRNGEDAYDAVKATDGMNLKGNRIRVTFARPRANERRRIGPTWNLRCYSCNRKGHFSRDCPEFTYSHVRRSSRLHSRSPSYRRPPPSFKEEWRPSPYRPLYSNEESKPSRRSRSRQRSRSRTDDAAGRRDYANRRTKWTAK